MTKADLINAVAAAKAVPNDTSKKTVQAVIDETFEQIKKDTEEFMFGKWIKEEKTADGWVLTWEMPKMDMSGDEPKQVGTLYSFEVRRKLGDKLHKCYGAVAKADGLPAVLKTCNTLKTK